MRKNRITKPTNEHCTDDKKGRTYFRAFTRLECTAAHMTDHTNTPGGGIKVNAFFANRAAAQQSLDDDVVPDLHDAWKGDCLCVTRHEEKNNEFR